LPYLLGIDAGSETTRTVVCRRLPETGGWGPPEPVVTDSPPAVPGLLRRCGDRVPVYHEELLVTPEALVVEQVRRAADTVWERSAEGPERFAVAYPTGWGPGRVGLLRAAFDAVGMSNVVLITRARAVVERHQALGRPLPPGRPILVCRIGRTGTEVTLAVPYEPGRLELLGTAEVDDLGGDDLAGAGPAAGRAAAAALLDLVRSTLRASGAGPDDLSAVLPAGGGAAHPLVTEVLAEAIAAPVIREDDPWLTVARGAALSLRAPGEVRAPDENPVASILVLPTEMLPITGTRLVAAEPGEIPPRPPLQVTTPWTGGRA